MSAQRFNNLIEQLLRINVRLERLQTGKARYDQWDTSQFCIDVRTTFRILSTTIENRYDSKFFVLTGTSTSLVFKVQADEEASDIQRRFERSMMELAPTITSAVRSLREARLGCWNNTTVDKSRASRALEQIESLLLDLDKFFDEAQAQFNLDDVIARIPLWDSRASSTLSKAGLPDIAERIGRRRGEVYYHNLRSLKSRLASRRSMLTAILTEVSEYPESYFARSKEGGDARIKSGVSIAQGGRKNLNTDAAIELLSELEERFKSLLDRQAFDYETVKSLHDTGAIYVAQIFGEKSQQLKTLDDLDPQYITGAFSSDSDIDHEVGRKCAETVRAWATKLEAFRKVLQLRSTQGRDLAEAERGNRSASKRTKSGVKRVFIVHGHDELNMRRLKEILEDQLGLEAVVMMDHPPEGMKTFIAKFQKLAELCDYAIALFTKDDFIQKKDESSGKTIEYFQGRPNVLFELGWFVARLTDDKVLLLVENGTTMPSDLQGVEELRFKSGVSEQFGKIQGALKKSGIL